MRVIHHNIQGLNQAIYNVYNDMIDNNEADIVFLSETWHNKNITTSPNQLFHTTTTAARIPWGARDDLDSAVVFFFSSGQAFTRTYRYYTTHTTTALQ